jgi:hypothetical protein
MSFDWYVGGEYVADEAVSSTTLGFAYERRLWRHFAAGAALSYIQPGSVVLPLVPGIRGAEGRFSIAMLRESSRMVTAQARLRLVFPFADEKGEIGVSVAAGPAFLTFPERYRGWGEVADVGVDGAWFWSQWGVAFRWSGELGVTSGHKLIGGPSPEETSADIYRVTVFTWTGALIRRF